MKIDNFNLCKVCAFILSVISNDICGMQNIGSNSYTYNIDRKKSKANQNICKVDLYLENKDSTNHEPVDTRVLREMHTVHAIVLGDNVGGLSLCYSMDNCLRIYAYPKFRFSENDSVIINALSFEEVFFCNNFLQNIKIFINTPKSYVNFWYNGGRNGIFLRVIADCFCTSVDSTELVVYDYKQTNQFFNVNVNEIGNRYMVVCNKISGTFLNATEFLGDNPELCDYRDVKICTIMSFPNADSVTLKFPQFDLNARLFTKPKTPLIIKGKVQAI